LGRSIGVSLGGLTAEEDVVFFAILLGVREGLADARMRRLITDLLGIFFLK
jgi:hypothetical protein